MYIVHPPSLMNKSFYTRTPLSKRGTNSTSAWNNFHFSNQSERVWILTCSMYKSMICPQILRGKRWTSVEMARPDLPEAGSRWYYLFLFSFFAKGGKGLKQVGRMYLRPIVDDSICTALPTWPQTNRPQGGAGASSSQLDSGFENKICSQSLIRPNILEHWREPFWDVQQVFSGQRYLSCVCACKIRLGFDCAFGILGGTER